MKLPTKMRKTKFCTKREWPKIKKNFLGNSGFKKISNVHEFRRYEHLKNLSYKLWNCVGFSVVWSGIRWYINLELKSPCRSDQRVFLHQRVFWSQISMNRVLIFKNQEILTYFIKNIFETVKKSIFDHLLK